MLLISDTADVFQDEILPLKADAPSNIAYIVVTAEVSQLDRSDWLNFEAPENMLLISDTADVFQDEILPLKADAL